MKVRMAVRDWDYLTPLALGDVRADGIELILDRVATLPENLGTDTRYDASEISFSRYITGRATGDTGITGYPNFLMRGFRHRCIITTRDSGLTRIEDLRGKRIGLTGWQDSGNTWTRAAMARADIGIDDAFWFVGRLSLSHPVMDRIGRYARPGRVEVVPNDEPVLDLLLRGDLDAVMTAFMPPEFFAPDSPFRPLLPDVQAAEQAYFDAVGYVPGIHVLGIKSEVAAEHPWLGKALSDLIDRSVDLWTEKRRRYADTTPWIIEDLRRASQVLSGHWNASGLEPNRRMIEDFLEETRRQGLADTTLTPDALFPAGGQFGQAAQ